MRTKIFQLAFGIAVLVIMSAFAGCIGGGAPKSGTPESDCPGAVISASARSMQAGGDEPINFDASNSTGAIVSYKWDFGDGKTGGGITIEHTYEEPGYYTVNLTVAGKSGETDMDSIEISAFVPLESAVADWTDPAAIGMTYPDAVKADLLTRPVFIFFWHEGCPWCTVQEAEANELVDAQYMGKVSIFKINTHTDLGRLWAKDYFHLMYVPTNIVIRQDNNFVSLIGAAKPGDLEPYLDDALKFKEDNAKALNITEMSQDGIISPASPAVQVPIDIKDGTAVLTAYVLWDKAQDAGIAALNSLNIVITAPDGTNYDAAVMMPFDPTKAEAPGNLKPDPYRTISVANPSAGTWKIDIVASGAGGAAPAVTAFTLHVLTRGGDMKGCHDGVCPP